MLPLRFFEDNAAAKRHACRLDMTYYNTSEHVDLSSYMTKLVYSFAQVKYMQHIC